MIGNGSRGIYILSVLFLLIFCGIFFAQDTEVQKSNWLLDVITNLENIRENAIKDIQQYEGEIQKCENIISKSENIVSLARQQGNAQAETIAKEALTKATTAKEKNQETLKFKQFYKELLERKIIEYKNLAEKIEKNKPDHARNEKTDDCKKLEVQLEMDKRVLENYLKTIDMTNKERTDWTEESKEAISEAQESIIKYLKSEFANILTERTGNIKKIKGQIDKYKTLKAKEVFPNKYLLDRLNTKLEKAEELYNKLSMKSVAKYAIKTDDFLSALKNEYELSQKMIEKEDQDITEVLKDMEIREKLSDIGSFFVDALIDHENEIRKASKFFSKVSPWLSTLPLVRDLSYAGLKLYLSSERISQLSDVAEQELKAVKALKKQIEKTMGKLKECQERVKTEDKNKYN